MSYPVKCTECDGNGEVDTGTEIIECPICEGKGKIDPEEDFTGEE